MKSVLLCYLSVCLIGLGVISYDSYRQLKTCEDAHTRSMCICDVLCFLMFPYVPELNLMFLYVSEFSLMSQGPVVLDCNT